MLGDPVKYRQVKDDLVRMKTRLGDGGASARAAAVVLELLERQRA
jgi:hypothetical protein